MARFERATLWSQTRCATMLRYIPYTKNALQSHMRCRASLSVWGEMRDLNSRPPGPQPGALPTELISPCEKGTYTIDGLLASIFSKRTEFSQCFTRFSFWIFSGRTRIPLKNHAPASSGPFVSQSVAGKLTSTAPKTRHFPFFFPLFCWKLPRHSKTSPICGTSTPRSSFWKFSAATVPMRIIP